MLSTLLNTIATMLGSGSDEDAPLATQLVKILRDYIFPAVLLVVGIWAIWIGFNIAKAEDDNARRQAKSRLFKALFALFAIAMFYGLLQLPVFNAK